MPVGNSLENKSILLVACRCPAGQQIGACFMVTAGLLNVLQHQTTRVDSHDIGMAARVLVDMWCL